MLKMVLFFLFFFLIEKSAAANITGIEPNAIQAGVPTKITLKGTVDNGDKVYWTTNSLCNESSPTEVDPTNGNNSATDFTISSAGVYNLCKKDSGSGTYTKVPNVTLTVTNTNPRQITGIFPKLTTEDVLTKITLIGTVGEGDLVKWSTNCASSAPDTTVTAGVDKSNEFTFPTAGNYSLCYRASGNSDSVAQQGVSIQVVAKTSATLITGISPNSILENSATNVALYGTISNGDKIVWAPDCSAELDWSNTDANNPYDAVSPTIGTDQVTAFTLTTIGDHKLCLRQAGKTDSMEQVGIQLTVIPLTEAIRVRQTVVFTGLSIATWRIHSNDLSIAFKNTVAKNAGLTSLSNPDPIVASQETKSQKFAQGKRMLQTAQCLAHTAESLANLGYVSSGDSTSTTVAGLGTLSCANMFTAGQNTPTATCADADGKHDDPFVFTGCSPVSKSTDMTDVTYEVTLGSAQNPRAEEHRTKINNMDASAFITDLKAEGTATSIKTFTTLSATLGTATINVSSIAPDYVFKYYDISSHWSKVPLQSEEKEDDLPTGCACEVAATDCVKYECGCTCNNTHGVCDANCCCDPDCSTEQVQIAKDSNSCAPEGPKLWTSTTCIPSSDLYELNPTLRMDSFINDQLLCIKVDNYPGKGSFWPEVKVMDSTTAFLETSRLPAFRFKETSGVSRLYPVPTLTNYGVGDRIPLVQASATLGDPTLKWAFGGKMIVPTADVNGICNDNNSIGFGQNVKSSCTRKVVTSTGQCTQTALDLNIKYLKIGKTPNVVPGSTSSFIDVTLSGGKYFNTHTGEYTNFNGNPANISALKSPSQNVGNGNARCGCSNVVKEIDYVINSNGKGEIVSVNATLVLIEKIQTCTTAYLQTRFSVTWGETSSTATKDFASGNIVPRPLSGAPGYRFGAPINFGTTWVMSQSTSSSKKRAVKMLEQGMELPRANSNGLCAGENGMHQIGFGIDTRTCCPVSLSLAQLQ
eukprot:g5669.t1